MFQNEELPGNQREAEALYAAALNNNIQTLEQLLGDNHVDPNIKLVGYDNTALHGAVFCRHVQAVAVLLKYGADKTLPDCRGKTALDINSEMFNQDIFDLLNPRIALKQAKRVAKLTVKKRRYYHLEYTFPTDIHILYNVADEYCQHETVTLIRSRINALTYIRDAIFYITLEALEAAKFSEYSAERWNISSRLIRMMHCISACAYYVSETDISITQRSSGIPWKQLSRFVRLEQYHPFFLTGISHEIRAKLIYGMLYRMALNGEFEGLRNICIELLRDPKFIQNVKLIPSFLRLYGFFNDEFFAQYLLEGAKLWRRCYGSNEQGARESILRSIMIVGEAFNHASQVLCNYFSPTMIEKFKAARTTLCHPERPEDRAAIEAILNGSNLLLVNSGSSAIFLEQLNMDMNIVSDMSSKHLQDYYNSQRPLLLKRIIKYGSDRLWSQPFRMRNQLVSESSFDTLHTQFKLQQLSLQDNVQKQQLHERMQKEVECRLNSLNNIPTNYRRDNVLDEIKKINYYLADNELKLKRLQNQFLIWVNQYDLHPESKQQDLRQKLNDPQKALAEIVKSLDKHEENYEATKYKFDNNFLFTNTDCKLIIDYNNVMNKYNKWKKYAEEKTKLENDCKQKKTEIDFQHIWDSRIKTVAFINFCIEQARSVAQHFNLLNKPSWVHSSALEYMARGFPLHPDHYILEFYQIMVGSCARALLENERFMQAASPRLQEIFRKTSKPSRGYLAHLGVRQEGRALQESQDRAQVFDRNSTQIIETIPLLEEAREIFEFTQILNI